MRVTPPVDILDANLTSSTAVEPHAPAAYSAGTAYSLGDIRLVAADFTIYEYLQVYDVAVTGKTPNSSPLYWRILGPTEDAYNAGTTYGLGATVSSATTHRCYESLAAGNIGNPLPVLPETTTTKWLDVGPTNKWAAFDFSRNTQTVTASSMTLVVAPGQRCNTLGLSGMVANSLTVSATSVTGGGTVYGPNTYDLNTREVADGYDYAFSPFTTRPSKVLFDLPPYLDLIVTVTLTATAGNVKCGAMVLGTYVYLGTVDYHAKADSLNFSTVTRDNWGNATLIPKRGVPKTNQTLQLSSARVSKAMDVKVALDAKAALWTGLDDNTSDWFELLEILGIWKQFQFDAALPGFVDINLELEEI